MLYLGKVKFSVIAIKLSGLPKKKLFWNGLILFLTLTICFSDYFVGRFCQCYVCFRFGGFLEG